MTFRHGVFGAVVGSATTAALFFVLAPQAPVPPPSATPTRSPVPADTPAATTTTTLQARVDSLLAERSQLAAKLADAMRATGGDTRALLLTNQELQRQVKEVQTELRRVEARQDARFEPFPTDLPARFSEQALLSTFRQAWEEVGVTGEVGAIDCSEYPCIVFGEVGDDQEEDRLSSAPALAAFKGDAHSAFGTTVTDADGKPRRMVAHTYTPNEGGAQDEAGRERIRERTHQRVKDMWKSMKP